jgi:hypothetical protein
MLPLLG